VIGKARERHGSMDITKVRFCSGASLLCDGICVFCVVPLLTLSIIASLYSTRLVVVLYRPTCPSSSIPSSARGLIDDRYGCE